MRQVLTVLLQIIEIVFTDVHLAVLAERVNQSHIATLERFMVLAVEQPVEHQELKAVHIPPLREVLLASEKPVLQYLVRVLVAQLQLVEVLLIPQRIHTAHI